MLAAIATIGLGLVLGPEAPLIALGSGLGAFAIRSARKDAPDQVVTIVAAAGSFAALSFVFSSPLIAAVILIEATGIGGPRLRVVLLPGLLAAGIGSLVSIGMGSFTGLSSSAYALSALPLPAFGSPHVANFGWTIALGDPRRGRRATDHARRTRYLPDRQAPAAGGAAAGGAADRRDRDRLRPGHRQERR